MVNFVRAWLSAALLLAATGPACALDYRAALKALFGSDEPKDLGVPIFIGLIALAALMLYLAMVVGKRRQRREIDAYNAQLAAYSANLRKGHK